MSGAQRPFLYDQEKYDDARFPPTTFDPKAVTRASWEVKPPRVKPTGPLVRFNEHPDLQGVLPQRTNNAMIAGRTKRWIVRLRVFQLCLRVPELIAALGILALFILLVGVQELTAWIERITAGVVALHCTYSIYHLQRPAGERPPASSASYMGFSALFDITGLGLYTFGVIAVIKDSMNWTSRIESPPELREYFVKSVYYALIASAGLHFVSFVISAWLAFQFRQITRLPPDMNPLEPHLTARHVQAGRWRKEHKRSKSSVATTATHSSAGSSSRLSTPLESHRRSGMPYEDVSTSRPPSIPFSHTRHGSDYSIHSDRDSRVNLPSRQYQISPTNSPRHSASPSQLHALTSNLPSAPRPKSVASSIVSPPSHRSSRTELNSRGSYVELPLAEPSAKGSGSGDNSTGGNHGGRPAKFTESWLPSQSLIYRTQQRQQMAIESLVRSAATGDRPYAVVNQRRDLGHDDGVSDESDDENDHVANGGLYDDATRRRRPQNPIAPHVDDDDESDLGSSIAPPPVPSHRHTMYLDRPDPLRSNPSTPPRTQTPFRSRQSAALSEISDLTSVAAGGQDIADLKPSSMDAPMTATSPSSKSHRRRKSIGRELSKRMTWNGAARQRDSSIQPESGFYSKPYGDLRSATPPEMVTSVNIKIAGTGVSSPPTTASPRQVSTGNDYYRTGPGGEGFSRRNVSGKMAEEGRAGTPGYAY